MIVVYSSIYLGYFQFLCSLFCSLQHANAVGHLLDSRHRITGICEWYVRGSTLFSIIFQHFFATI